MEPALSFDSGQDLNLKSLLFDRGRVWAQCYYPDIDSDYCKTSHGAVRIFLYYPLYTRHGFVHFH